jgi:hypothetical protein
MNRIDQVLKKRFFIGWFCAIMLVGCNQQVDEVKLHQLTDTAVMDWNSKLTDVIVADIFTPLFPAGSMPIAMLPLTRYCPNQTQTSTVLPVN